MPGYDDSNIRQELKGWSDTLLPGECAELFDPRFILARAVRSEVVTRLAADRAASGIGKDAVASFDAEQRRGFLDAILSDRRGAFDDAVDGLALREKPFDVILRQLVTPVLDDLGQMWRDDRASFVEVTLAACRVQTFVCEKLSATATRDRQDEMHGSIAFARPVGETHTLGLTVVTECFRIDGWSVMGGVDLEIGDALWRLLVRQSIDVLGLTVGSVPQIEPVTAAIAKARHVSGNPDLIIAIGGYCAVSDPELVEAMGADFVATDALDAIDTAASYVGARRRARA